MVKHDVLNLGIFLKKRFVSLVILGLISGIVSWLIYVEFWAQRLYSHPAIGHIDAFVVDDTGVLYILYGNNIIKFESTGSVDWSASISSIALPNYFVRKREMEGVDVYSVRSHRLISINSKMEYTVCDKYMDGNLLEHDGFLRTNEYYKSKNGDAYILFYNYGIKPTIVMSNTGGAYREIMLISWGEWLASGTAVGCYMVSLFALILMYAWWYTASNRNAFVKNGIYLAVDANPRRNASA